MLDRKAIRPAAFAAKLQILKLFVATETGTTLHIAGVYTTEQACRAEGQALSKARSPKGCNYCARHFYTYCVELSANPR